MHIVQKGEIYRGQCVEKICQIYVRVMEVMSSSKVGK